MNTEVIVAEVPGILVKKITDILSKLGHARPADWTLELHPDASITTDQGIQRFLINRCFRIILGKVTTEDTINTRFCLVDTGEIDRWLELFEDGVARTIVRLNLPEAIH